ncbi:MAG: hypothetical protein IKM46_00925 [Clostridia bacterium]|nr:hypothetical protein [Clostridia bacterium]
MDAIVYTSETGHTKAYAEILGNKTSIPVFEIKEAKRKLPKDAKIIYMGWLFASSIKGYKKAAKRYAVSAVVGVGLCPTGEMMREVRQAISLPESTPLFTMQGGMDHAKLRGINRFMINMLVKMLSKKERTPEEDAMLSLIKRGGYFVDEKNTEAFIKWYEDTTSDKM